MKYLQVRWIRLLVSFLAASITIEMFKVGSGQPNAKPSDASFAFLIIFGLVIYFILSYLVKNKYTIK